MGSMNLHLERLECTTKGNAHVHTYTIIRLFFSFTKPLHHNVPHKMSVHFKLPIFLGHLKNTYTMHNTKCDVHYLECSKSSHKIYHFFHTKLL